MAENLAGVMDAERLAVVKSVRGVVAHISDDDLLQIPGTIPIDIINADGDGANCCGKQRNDLKM